MAAVKVDGLAIEWVALVPPARWARGVLLRLLWGVMERGASARGVAAHELLPCRGVALLTTDIPATVHGVLPLTRGVDAPCRGTSIPRGMLLLVARATVLANPGSRRGMSRGALVLSLGVLEAGEGADAGADAREGAGADAGADAAGAVSRVFSAVTTGTFAVAASAVASSPLVSADRKALIAFPHPEGTSPSSPDGRRTAVER